MPTGSELRSQLAAVVAKYGVPDLATGEFTTAMLAAVEDLTYNRAALVVKRGLKAQALADVGLRRMPDGHVARAYRVTLTESAQLMSSDETISRG